MSTIIVAASILGTAIFVAAIINRLFTDRQMPKIIDDGVGAVANIFHGVFRG